MLFMWNKYFVAIKTARKLEKEIRILYSTLNTAFRKHCIYPKKRNIIEDDQKVEETNIRMMITCQGPSYGLLGGWSHDQLPKMVKKQKL